MRCYENRCPFVDDDIVEDGSAAILKSGADVFVVGQPLLAGCLRWRLTVAKSIKAAEPVQVPRHDGKCITVCAELAAHSMLKTYTKALHIVYLCRRWIDNLNWAGIRTGLEQGFKFGASECF